MKVKLIYKEGVVFQELPQSWYNRDRIYLPRKNNPTIGSNKDIQSPPISNEHVFEHQSFEKIGGELHKVLIEI